MRANVLAANDVTMKLSESIFASNDQVILFMLEQPKRI